MKFIQNIQTVGHAEDMLRGLGYSWRRVVKLVLEDDPLLLGIHTYFLNGQDKEIAYLADDIGVLIIHPLPREWSTLSLCSCQEV